jgi:hypothetical protein
MVKRVCVLLTALLFTSVSVNLFSRDIQEEIELLIAWTDIPARNEVKITENSDGISIVSYESTKVDVQVVDSNGNTVYATTLTSTSNRVTVSTSTLKSDSYTVLVNK